MGHLSLEEFLNLKADIEKMPDRARINIKKIEYVDSPKPMPTEYGEAFSEDTAGGEVFAKTKTIVFYKTKYDLAGEIKMCEYHEVGHLQAWDSNDLLNLDERMQLLFNILARVNAPDRFHSDYVEKINYSDPIIRMKKKSDEYYAEIWSAYFRNNKNLPEVDRAIIEWVLQKMNEKKL